MGYVDKKVALRYLANSELLFDKIRKSFLNNHKNTPMEIKQYINDNDISSLYNCIHSIKGVSLNVGSIPLYDDSEAVLEVLKKGELNISLINIFIDTFNNVYSELLKL
ncbi:MAG: Hpt domain-containing protein [Anaeroplasma sp.]